jgi:DUF4097 and DUF4098 domain-containing protein YvlB/uncharacterized membrane protein HdeD (DUF308 family)
MLKRYSTLLVGVALVGVGVLFFAVPERGYVLQILVRFWPLFLILAGLVRVTGHLLDRHPRSPVGGLILTALGGILLAANLRGDRTFLHLLGRYWFWLLLALILGRVIRQYTHREEGGPRPRLFGVGTILLMLVIVGGGLAANYLAASPQLLSRLHLRLGSLGEVRDYVFGGTLAVDDELAQTFALRPGARLVVGEAFGDVEVRGGSQPVASARLLKRIRASSEDEARQAAKNIQLQITQNGAVYQLGLQRADAGQPQIADFTTSLVLELPVGVPVGVEVHNPVGQVKLANLSGDHAIYSGENIEVSNNLGHVSVNQPRGTVQLRQIQGEVSVMDARRDLSLREITGHVTLSAQNGAARLEQIVGQIRARFSNARVEIREVRGAAALSPAQWLVNLEESSQSRINLRDISGSVTIAAASSRVEAQAISGHFAVSGAAERVQVSRITGELNLDLGSGEVEADNLAGAARIEAARDVTVRDFRGPLSVNTRRGAIRLVASAPLGGEVRASNERGQIRVTLPADIPFRLDADTTFGKMRLRGFEHLSPPRNRRSLSLVSTSGSQAAPLLYLRSVNGDIRLEAAGAALARGADGDDREPDN